jgi:arylsulfatase A-like enzyme
LLDGIAARGFMDRTIIVVTSDHGEQLWEHGGFRHGQTMYDHQLLVPLILYLPPGLRRELGGGAATEGLVIEDQVRLIDLYPTLLELLGVPLDHTLHGRSLVPLLKGESLPPVDAFAENTNGRLEMKALRSARYKFIRAYPTDPVEGEIALFDLSQDPHEQHNIADRMPELTEALRQRIDALTSGDLHTAREQEVPEGLDPELEAQLEALGYLGSR